MCPRRSNNHRSRRRTPPRDRQCLCTTTCWCVGTLWPPRRNSTPSRCRLERGLSNSRSLTRRPIGLYCVRTATPPSRQDTTEFVYCLETERYALQSPPPLRRPDDILSESYRTQVTHRRGDASDCDRGSRPLLHRSAERRSVFEPSSCMYSRRSALPTSSIGTLSRFRQRVNGSHPTGAFLFRFVQNVVHQIHYVTPGHRRHDHSARSRGQLSAFPPSAELSFLLLPVRFPQSQHLQESDHSRELHWWPC